MTRIPLSSHLPNIAGRTAAFATGDIDGDGDIDSIVLASSPDVSRALINDGRGIFADRRFGIPTHISGYDRVALQDLDADGDLDMLVSSGIDPFGTKSFGRALYLQNDGNGRFTDVTDGLLCPCASILDQIAVADVDGDGDLDIAGPTLSGQTVLLLNDGLGRFFDATASNMPVDDTLRDFRVPAFGDVDGDGDVDLLQLYRYGPAPIYLNDGTGVFSIAPTSSLPFPPGGFPHSARFVDIDGDGDLDIVAAFATTARKTSIYLNDGTGVFFDASVNYLPLGVDGVVTAVGDMTGDGAPDLIIGSPGLRLLVNPRSFGPFTSRDLPMQGHDLSALAVADVDADGDLDVLVGQGNPGPVEDELLLNDGLGRFVNATVRRVPAALTTDEQSGSSNELESRALDAGDVDGDGDIDVIVGNIGRSGVNVEVDQLMLNRGDGTFEDATLARTSLRLTSTMAGRLVDVDRDGDLDWIRGTRDGLSLELNDGTGTFTDATATHLPATTATTSSLDLGDVDGDGDVDLVTAYGLNTGLAPTSTRGPKRLYLNDGTGRFREVTATQMPGGMQNTLGVTLGDVDGDGDLDAAFANLGGASNELLINDGSGNFSVAAAGRLPLDTRDSRCVAFGDIDGDGDLDLVFGGTDSEDLLYVNDGLGTFTDVSAVRGTRIVSTTYAIGFRDVNGDGALDLVRCTSQIDAHVTINNGQGFFHPVFGSPIWTIENLGKLGTAFVVADFDGDGDADLMTHGRPGPRVYLGTTRPQLDTPFLARVGSRYVVRVRTNFASAITAIFLSAVAAPTPIPTPFGLFRLDPATSIVAITNRTLDVTIPPNSSLLGATLHWQGVATTIAAPGIALTDLASDTVIR